MSRSPRWIAVLLVLAVVLAGCSAGGGGPSGTESPGTATGTPSTTETPAVLDGPPYEAPLDAETVLRAHEDAVGEAGSYTFDTELSVVEPRTNASIHDRWYVEGDLVDGRMYLLRNATLANDRLVYVDADGRGYEPRTVNGKRTYQRPADGLTDPWRYATPNLAEHIDGIDFTDAGTTTRDGETVYVYSARERSQFNDSLLNLRYYWNGTIRNVSATLLVAESGAIRSFDFRINGTDAEGDTIRYSAPLTYDRVGNTSVREPGWLEEARSELDGG